MEAEAKLELLRNQTAVQSSTPSVLQGGSWDLLRDPRGAWARLDTAGRRRALHPLLEVVMIHQKQVTEVRFTRFGMEDDSNGTTSNAPESLP